MISKIKNWLIGKVIVKKVLGKWVKHASGALSGLILGAMSGPWFVSHVSPIIENIPQLKDLFTPTNLEGALIVVLTGLFGAIFNYVEHRFIKK